MLVFYKKKATTTIGKKNYILKFVVVSVVTLGRWNKRAKWLVTRMFHGRGKTNHGMYTICINISRVATPCTFGIV